jgi:hypothetical protein
MRDFFGEDAEKVQDTWQCCWVCSKSVDHISEDIFPLRHLYCQIRQTNTQLQPDGLGPGVESRQVPHYGGSKLRELCPRDLV